MRKLILSVSLLTCAAFAADFSNIEYSRPAGKPLLLDVHVPDGKGPFPAVIIVHGGSWRAGNKTTYINPLKKVVADAGYAWFSIDYRLTPASKFPSNVEDVENAVKWVKAHARKYRLDKKRIVLAGESAGGHLVGMVGAQNKPKSRVAAVVDFYGPNNLSIVTQIMKEPIPDLRDLLGITTFDDAAKKLLAEASPITYVKAGMPPFYFIHGTADTTVPFMMSPMMCDAMKKVSAPCEVYTVKDGVHGMENWEGKPGQTEWKAPMVAWLNRTLKR